jgi:hypothetical protein
MRMMAVCLSFMVFVPGFVQRRADKRDIATAQTFRQEYFSIILKIVVSERYCQAVLRLGMPRVRIGSRPRELPKGRVENWKQRQSHVFTPPDYAGTEVDMRSSDSILAYVEYLLVHTPMPSAAQLARLEVLKESAAKVAKEEGERASLFDGARPRLVGDDPEDAWKRLSADRAAAREANK